MGDQPISFNMDEWHKSIKEDWSRQGKSFGRHVDFPSNHVFKMNTIKVLGSGGYGKVVMTKCEYEYHGTTRKTFVALKKYYIPKTDRDSILREISILKRLRHHHVTEFVGSYSQNEKFRALFWPVAAFSLADVFDALNNIGNFLNDNNPIDPIDPNVCLENIDPAISLGKWAEVLAQFIPGTPKNLPKSRSLQSVIQETVRRLFVAFGCLAEAVEYIHGQRVWHRDLKPANILIFPSVDCRHDCGPYDPNGIEIEDGLRITDFNLSKERGAYSFSATHSVAGTAQYSAPEVLKNDITSDSRADIFSLGCIFLEILCMLTIEPVLFDQSLQFCSPTRLVMSQTHGYKCYSANMGNFDQWIMSLNETGASQIKQHLFSLVESMMDEDPGKRPISKQVAIRLAVIEQLRTKERGRDGIGEAAYSLFGKCCKPAKFEREDYRLLRRVFPAIDGGARPSVAATNPSRAHTAPVFPEMVKTGSLTEAAALHDDIQSIPKVENVMFWNQFGQRIDPTPIPYDRGEVTRVSELHLCYKHYLLQDCEWGDKCNFNHNYVASDKDIRTLQRIMKSRRMCQYGLFCDDSTCVFGHNCPNSEAISQDVLTKMSNCHYRGPSPKGKCMYPTELHDLDTKIAYRTLGKTFSVHSS